MVIGAAVVGQNGGFTVSPATALPQGAHLYGPGHGCGRQCRPRLGHAIRDRHGLRHHASRSSDPSVGTPNGSSNDTTPAVTGTAEAGTTVSLLENGFVIGTAIVGLDGTFAVSPATPLGQGDHTFRVKDTDLSGNVGPGVGARHDHD